MADSLIYDLCKVVCEQLLKTTSLLHDVPEEAKNIEQNLVYITAVLKAAEQREIGADVKVWLSDLKNLAYDIEDVLEDCTIAELLMADDAGTSQQGTNVKDKLLSFFASSYVWSTQLFSRHDISQRIISINVNLGGIVERKNRFNFLTSNNRINEGPELQPTSAYGDYAVVPSQEAVKAKVIQMLVDGDSKGNVANSNRIPIISLSGMGGIGKTTVARLVYHNDRVNGHFSKTIWVGVSKPFNGLNVAKAIAEGLNLDVKNYSRKQNVLSKIEASIKGQKFLLVLDDVWEDSEGKWSDILDCLGKGDEQGSRILMATRNKEFSKKMGAGIVSVEALCARDAMLLFSYYAFIEDSDRREEVKDTAEKLVEKCHGLPIALEVLGRYMSTKTTWRQWDVVLRSELWKTEFENRVFNSLAVSYLELPSAAKRCFAFCSIFRKDTAMTKYNLIRLWMAQGYLEGCEPDQMEVLGETCFESLERRAFFRVSKIPSDKVADVTVTMHDLLLDFAHYVSNGEEAIWVPSRERGVNSEKIRHLAIRRKPRESNLPDPNFLSSTFDYGSLRTLFLSIFPSAAVIEAVCSTKSYIRALDIQSFFKPTRDADVGNLVHLRYLRLRANVLPKEICALPFLQTLDVSRCVDVETLPDGIERLTSLRHLLLGQRFCSLPKGVGKLSSLQTLSYFPCSARANDGGSSIEDLRDLNNLRGELRLKKLNNVANVDEATRAELHMKTQISKLCLQFGNGDDSLQTGVLEALKPAEGSIEILEIRHHRGTSCPRWMGKMRRLKEVLLQDVSMKCLPEMGMLRFLEKLTIRRAYEVTHVGTEFFGKVMPDEGFFPRLRNLHFIGMSQWRHWEAPDVTTTSGDRVKIMPSLCCLGVHNCGVLERLPRFLEHVPLESLELHCKSLLLVEAVGIDYPYRWLVGHILLPRTINHIITPSLRLSRAEVIRRKPAVPRNIVDWTYLTKIEVENIEDESLPPFGLFPSILELTIRDAHNVGKVGDEFLGMSSNNTTAAFVGVFPRLEKLTFQMMSAWREWEDPVHGGNTNLRIMPSLRRLSIRFCPKLKALPSFLRSVPLEQLDIVDCPGLATWWINEAGEDWRNWKSKIPRFNFPDSETDDESP